MKKIWAVLRPALWCFMIMTLLLGVIYPAVITGIAQIAFPKQANGSIITISSHDGTEKEIGSAFIAQEFTSSRYLIGRPFGTANLSPVSDEQNKAVQQRIKWWYDFDAENSAVIPLDLVTTSGTAADPNISPEAADYQVTRIARARNMTENEVKQIISRYTSRRLLGFWGEPAVNVLKVNLALDGLI